MVDLNELSTAEVSLGAGVTVCFDGSPFAVLVLKLDSQNIRGPPEPEIEDLSLSS